MKTMLKVVAAAACMTVAAGAYAGAAEDLARAGSPVVELDLPPAFAAAAEGHRWISSYEFTKNFTYEITHHFDRISQTLRAGRITDGLGCTPQTYEQALALAFQLLQQVRLQIGAAGHFEHVEDGGEGDVVLHRVFLMHKKLEFLVQVFQPQQRAYALVERIFVDDQNDIPLKLSRIP